MNVNISIYIKNYFKISDNDGLPPQICLKCVCRISDAFLFKLNCEKSERMLRDNLLTKSTELPIEIEDSRNDNCDTFKDNVINLINIAVNETNSFDATLNSITESAKNNNDEAPEINNLNQNDSIITSDNTIERTLVDNKKRKQKCLKLSKKSNRVHKMVKIAPKQNTISTNAYNDKNQFIAINIPCGNLSVAAKQPQITKLTTNLDIKGQCKVCGIYFIYENELQLHLSEAHGINTTFDSAKYFCNICNIEFSLYEKLNEHNVLEHCKNISYQCNECLNWYSDKELLKKHKCLVHTKINNELSCDICPKKFQSIRGLTIHKTLHNIKSKEKISCKICDRTFSVMSNLTYHMKYHKSDVCYYCNSGFCNLNMMKVHIKENHSGKKPYCCSYCHKNFNVRKVLLRHKRIVHGVFNDIYFCGMCKNSSVGFLTYEILNKHITKYHKLPNDEQEQASHSESNDNINKSDIISNLEKSTPFLNICSISNCEKNEIDTLGFDNSLCNNNLTQLIDLTDNVNTNQITLNDDGTINISINQAALQNIQDELHVTNFPAEENLAFTDAIENTIKVLKQEIFVENKIENNFSVTDMGEYTINEINREDNQVISPIKNNIDISQTIIGNVEISDLFTSGKIIDYDEGKQLYTLRYENIDYVISAEGLNQTQNDFSTGSEAIVYHDAAQDNPGRKDDNESIQLKETDKENCEAFSCKICNLTFVDEVSFADHIPKHNMAARSLDECKNLQKTAIENSTEIKDGMIRINIDSTTGIVTFEKSDVLFSEQDYSQVSKGEKVDVPRYRCPKCDDLFTRQYSLNRHLAHTHNEMCLVCNTCGESFNRVSLLEEHRSKHKNMLNMGVIITSVEKTTNESVDGNLEPQNSIQEIESLYVYEPENQSYPCELCNKTFQRQIYLERHRLVHMGITQPGFMCSTCNKIFLTSIDMQKHKRKHNEEYLQCNLCDRTFTTIGGLKYHLKTHTGTKNHKCPFCGKKFTANVNLNAHIKTVHSEVKPHLCNICGKRYTTIDHLRKHMVYHTGERKFQCNVCGKDFTQNSHLTQHSWIHSGIKPHACKYCNNKYTSSSALKKHLQTNHVQIM